MYEKKISDCDFKKYQGKHFDTPWYTTHIIDSQDGHYLDNGVRKVLFKFRKGVVSSKYSDIAKESFLELSKKKHSNRGMASGIPNGQKNARVLTKTGQNEGQYIASNISGYFDRPLREHRGTLGTIKACRTTAFTLDNSDLWKSGILFIQRCSKLYKKFAPKEHSLQKKEWDSIHKDIKIPKTVFTTITSNYNWRTACHLDAGDYTSGLGNLIVLGHNFRGGYLGFPQFKVLIHIEPGDFLLMDVHQWHCNTPIFTKKDGYRLSFVMYIREDMSKCSKKINIGKTKYLTI
jgi:hypothetical protein